MFISVCICSFQFSGLFQHFHFIILIYKSDNYVVRFLKLIIIIIMVVIFKCYFSREHIALFIC